MKLNLKYSICLLGSIILLSSFHSENKGSKKIVVENKLDFDRNEVVSIDLNANKKLSKIKDFNTLLVKDEKGKLLVTQLIDNNADGTPDELLFQVTVPANSKVVYTLFSDSSLSTPKSNVTTYARFVPERIDDFAWENDKVAFRTYGPEA